jgi:parallel beta-helix repeat protein
MRAGVRRTALAIVTVAAAASPAVAATKCVSHTPKAGCFTTISAAVAAAAPFDTIAVRAGTYAEDVTIPKPLSIIGAGPDDTIVDATGLPNGFTIDGLHNPGLEDVNVRGFTSRHAKFEGILISNASDVTISGNKVVHNNRSLSFPNCPDIPPPDSQAGEGFDCGEGIHLIGVKHSTIASNIVEKNAGGILLTDETGPTRDNLISANVVRDNAFDCGITLASHRPVAPNGVHHNTIAGNDVSHNGLLGQGAGIGLFAPIPGTATYANVVVANRAVGNGLPGVALHSHAPGQNLNDNKIMGNYLADNGIDGDAQTPGTTGIVIFGVSPITGTTISQNVIEHEQIGIAVKTNAEVDAHLNDLNTHHVGVANLDSGSVDATENWWGCAGGPGAPGCATATGAGVRTTPWLRHPIHP